MKSEIPELKQNSKSAIFIRFLSSRSKFLSEMNGE